MHGRTSETDEPAAKSRPRCVSAEKAPLRPMPRAAVTVDAGGGVDAGKAAAGEPQGAAGVACHVY